MANATAGPGPRAAAAAAASKGPSKSLSTLERQIWNKIKAAKGSVMTFDSVLDSLAQNDGAGPGKPQVESGLGNLIKFKLLTTTKINGQTGFVWQAGNTGDIQSGNDGEMNMCLGHIRNAGTRGISAKTIRMRAGQERITNVILRRALDALVRSGQIKSFKTINNPTLPMYVLAGIEPAEELVGGIWYKDNKEYDSAFVTTICKYLLTAVRKATYPNASKRPEAKKLVPNPIYASDKAVKLLSPAHLTREINASKITNTSISVKNVMECMRALELDGLVEVIKPLGGVADTDDDDWRPSKKSRDSSDDERERDKKEEKARERAIEKKRREKERKAEEKRRQKVKDAEKKAKKAAKKAKELAKKEKKRAKKEKEKRRKKHDSSEDEFSGDDSDILQDVNEADLDREDRSRSSSKKRDKKRKRRATSSDSDSDSSSDDSDSDSGSDSDSDSSSDGNISVDSFDIDDAEVELKPVSSKVDGEFLSMIHDSAFSSTALTNLDDEQVVYRATNRYRLNLATDQVPCGKCPRFHFCEEDGPVNPDGCNYFEDWLADLVGGWDAEGKKKYKPEQVEAEERARDEDLRRRRGEQVDVGANGDVETNGHGDDEDEKHDGEQE